jgi:hypothetical protein
MSNPCRRRCGTRTTDAKHPCMYTYVGEMLYWRPRTRPASQSNARGCAAEPAAQPHAGLPPRVGPPPGPARCVDPPNHQTSGRSQCFSATLAYRGIQTPDPANPRRVEGLAKVNTPTIPHDSTDEGTNIYAKTNWASRHPRHIQSYKLWIAVCYLGLTTPNSASGAEFM